jgi:glycosyltransferase involved in cell wall biosynthesis
MNLDTSVIITNFNRAHLVGRAIRSCVKQSMEQSRYEIIVVDDGSTDASKEAILNSTENVKPIFLKENVGVAEASNIGIKKALGAYVIRVDSDDYIAEHTLLFMTEIMIANPDIGFVYPDHFLVSADEKVMERVKLGTLDELYRHGAGIMFRKTNLEAIGLYDPKLEQAEDMDLLRRYFKNFDGYHLKLPLYRYRQHSGQVSQKGTRNQWEKKVKNKYK